MRCAALQDWGVSYPLGFVEAQVPYGSSLMDWGNPPFDLPRSRHIIATSVPIVTCSDQRSVGSGPNSDPDHGPALCRRVGLWQKDT